MQEKEEEKERSKEDFVNFFFSCFEGQINFPPTYKHFVQVIEASTNDEPVLN